MSRFLLCRPMGGLNDVLTQIELCCQYAEQTGRIVIVDTNYANDHFFSDDFGKYFVSLQEKLIFDPRAFEDLFDRLTVYPEFLSGRTGDYYQTFDLGTWRWSESVTKLPITFDFTKNYPHQLLIQHQFGGGEISKQALLRMRLQPGITDELVTRLDSIGPAYSAIHVRHTDYKTNYWPALSSLKNSNIKRLFVATDNRSVLEDFKAALGQERVFSFADFLSTDGEPIHNLELSSDETYSRNRDAILDLVMLALSSQLFILNIEPNKLAMKVSGFSSLARSLWASKIILKHLIGRSDIRFGLD